MLMLLISVLTVPVAVAVDSDPASLQALEFKEETGGAIGLLTNTKGAPISYLDAESSINSNLLTNTYFLDYLSSFSRERIPERVVHAKGAGAFGYFEVTHDISHICKADLFSRVGKKTPVAVRFSQVIPSTGSSDTMRDTRGFAIKFYTQQGNFDMVAINFPAFFVKDPMLFPSFIHSQKPNPQTNQRDVNTFWDFLSLRPESLFSAMYLFTDRGTPYSYRNMPGFSIHTLQLENEEGHRFFARFHILPDAGIKNLNNEQATTLRGTTPNYYAADLYNAIASGNFPTWTVSLQILTMSDIKSLDFDPFDITMVLPTDQFPLQPIGRVVLNRNQVNYFAEIEQLAFCPHNLVPGILGAPDKVYESRRFSYRDAQNYRLGVNVHKIEVNRPLVKTLYYSRDGVSPVRDNQKNRPNYYPNSFNGPVPFFENKSTPLLQIVQSETPNNAQQIKDCYLNEFTDQDRESLVKNLANDLGHAAAFIQDRVVRVFTSIYPELGHKIAYALKLNSTEVPKYDDVWAYL